MPETEFRITLNEQSQLTRVLEWLKRQQSFVVFWKISKRNLFELWLCRAQPASLTPPPPQQHHTQYTKRLRKLAAKYLPNWKLDLFSFHRQFVFHMQIFRWVENVSCNRVGECRWAHDNYLFTMLWSYDIAVAFNHPYFSFMFWIGERKRLEKKSCLPHFGCLFSR